MNKLVSNFEKPDYLFYLNSDEKLAAKRKKKFSRYECGFANELNEQTFKSFQQKTISHFQKLMNTISHTLLDASIPSRKNCKIILHSLNC
jgi:thymidylate kinase